MSVRTDLDNTLERVRLRRENHEKDLSLTIERGRTQRQRKLIDELTEQKEELQEKAEKLDKQLSEEKADKNDVTIEMGDGGSITLHKDNIEEVLGTFNRVGGAM